MTFNPNIPQPTDSPATDSQPQFLTNFQQLNTQFSQNHVALTALADNGKHTYVTLIDQGADPAVAVDEIALYSKSLGGVSTLYMRKENNGTVIQLSAQDPSVAEPGSTFLAGGVILKWGFGAIGSGVGGTTLTFVSAFPNNCWEVIITPLDPNALYASVVNKSVNNFAARASNACTIGYIAIGN